jgi:hypothetical protein
MNYLNRSSTIAGPCCILRCEPAQPTKSKALAVRRDNRCDSGRRVALVPPRITFWQREAGVPIAKPVRQRKPSTPGRG